jgi:large subunit ribosomal protein L1
MKRAKRYQKAFDLVDRTNHYSLDEAVELVKKTATAEFDETVELAVKLGVDPRQADQNIRGTVALPHGTGKEVRVIVFAQREEQIQEAKDAGADEVGGEELVQKILDGWLEFDVAIASPDMMRFAGRLGPVIGPLGLMPSPKAGTVTNDVGQAVREIKAGRIEYRIERSGSVINVPVGKASFEKEQIKDNVSTMMRTLVAARPASAKGRYLRNITLASTMGPGIKMNTGEFARRR